MFSAFMQDFTWIRTTLRRTSLINKWGTYLFDLGINSFLIVRIAT